MEIKRTHLSHNPVNESSMDDAQKEALKEQLARRETIPSTRHQSYSYQFFQRIVGDLGNPFDLTRIPISVCRQMERDPVLAFALYFIHVPIIRAKWHIECEDAQVAAFIDGALRRILASYIRIRKQAMNYGFVPVVKRFQLDQPNWKYLDPAKSDDELDVWPSDNIDAITWKNFVNLPCDPTIVEPKWNARGQFDGIKYQGGANLIPFYAIENSQDGSKTIPLSHALWLTNERESANGSIWGYPRTGYAYRYWWSYWFRWALFDRFFERKADPPYVVYYPVGGSQGDFAGEDIASAESMQKIALSLAESARSGGAIAMPGDVITGFDDRPTTIREWSIEELEVKGDINHFTESFEYLDIMKLRSLWISEFAVTEGQGGTSSRNTMGEQLGFHKEGAGALADEIDDELNKYVIPDLVMANFPNFHGDVRKVTTSFSESDQQTMQQALQWLGQSDSSALRHINVRELLERLGMPMLSHSEIRRQEMEAEKALQETQPDVIEPETGRAGVNEQGFYVQPRQEIYLASDNDFLASLPPSKHYSDRTIRALTRSLRKVWREAYREAYENFATHIETEQERKDRKETLRFADEEEARRIAGGWEFPRKRLDTILEDSQGILRRVIGRAGNVELRSGGFNPDYDPDNENVAAWLDERGLELVRAIDETIREEVRTYLAQAIEAGQSLEEIANGVRNHFADWPDWKADRLVRTEIRNSYNYATLAAGEQAGVRIVQARDALRGPTDEECEERNGQFFTIQEAFGEIAREHPNGTLAWQYTNRENLSIQRVEEIPNDSDALALFDNETDTIYLRNDIPLEVEQNYLLQLGDTLEK